MTTTPSLAEGLAINRISSQINGVPSRLRQAKSRRGSVLGLMAILLPVLAVIAAMCVNLSHIQVTRTELMVASDAAARAGGRAFSESQDVNVAKNTAVSLAAMNTVNGRPLRLASGDSANEIEFGTTTQPDGPRGRFVFQKLPTSQVQNQALIASAVRVVGKRLDDSLSGNVDLAIPGVLNTSDFQTQQDAVAMQVDRDISLVLDRSGSMEWRTFDWPSGRSPWYRSVMDAAVQAGLLYRSRGNYYYSSGVSSDDYQTWVWEEHYELGPAPSSPWEDLLGAVDAFLNVLDDTIQDEQVSISSYASSGSRDSWLGTDFGAVRATANGLNTGGATAIGMGMQQGITTLTHSTARPYASKTMVVMSDGVHNRGISPVDVAQSLAGSYNLTIHTVTFGRGADQSRMQQVASIGQGNHYHADSGAELTAVFEEIANNLPTILTD